MGKILLLIVLGFVAYALWRSINAKKRARAAGDTDPPADDAALQTMVQCHRCGVYLAKGDAIAASDRRIGRFYCSTEHAEEVPPK